MTTENQSKESTEASGVASSDLLALVDKWQSRADSYDRLSVRRLEDHGDYPGSDAFHEKSNLCGQMIFELKEVIEGGVKPVENANAEDRHGASDADLT